MPTFVAIDPRLDGPGQEGKVLLVMAETDSTGAINIVGVKSFQLPEGDGTLSGAPSEIAAGTELGTAEGGVFSAELGAEIPNLRDLEIESTLSLVSTRPVLYENLVLPFSDQKKIDQVIRFEVQDRLPFDLDSFLIDSMVLKKVDEKHYEILASLVPSLDVSTTLIRLKRLGADPKILSTRSSAVAALPQLFPELLAGNFALVIVTADLCATAFFIDNQMKTLREFSLPPDARSTDILSDICREIRCSIAKVEKETNQRINRCYLSGPKDLIAPFSRELDRSIELVDFASAVNIDPSVNLNGYDITWAIGLFANELSKLQKTRTPVVNFRRGAFAYKPTWGNILNALKDEIFYVGLAAFLGVVWCGTIIFTSYSALNRVESAIGSELSSSLPGMSITKRQEVTILRSKVTDLEEQLKGIGSLSALSPLESLKELSQAIGPEIDIKLEAINVSHDGLSFRGSVLDFPSVGRLNTALESRTGRFCKVKVDSKGTAPGSPRVKFQADITFCQ